MLLKDCTTIKGGKRLPKGQTLQNIANSHPYIRVKDMRSRYVKLDSTYEYVPDTVFPLISRYIVKKNDIILSIVGTVGLVAIVDESLNNASLTENCVKLINIKNYLPQFIYYYLYSEKGQAQISEGIVGSTQPKFPLYNIEKLDIPDISYEKQHYIVDILGTLDDKIENNDKIIKELTNLIQLEFEKTYRSNTTEEKMLTDIFSFQEGPGIRNWQYVDNGVNFINIRCINNGDIDTSSMNKISENEAFGIYKHFLLNEWDLVMSMSGTLGRYAIVRKEHLPLCLNTSVIRFYPKEDFSYYSYMYAYLTSKEFITSITMLANGSAQQNIGPTHLKKLTIKTPANEVVHKFHEKIFPLIQKLVSIRADNQKFQELKEYYLKKFFD